MSAEELLSLLALAAGPTALALSMLVVLPKVHDFFDYLHRRNYDREYKRLKKQGLKI